MRFINLYLAKVCRAIGDWHVDRADSWERRADMFNARAMGVKSDNIARIEPYDREKHGGLR